MNEGNAELVRDQWCAEYVKARDALRAEHALIVEAQRLLTRFLEGESAGATIRALIPLFDGPQEREALALTLKILPDLERRTP
jgi:hypothetical protein